MTPKIRNRIIRIAVSFALFIAAAVLEHLNPGGVFGHNILTFAMYLIPYLTVGYDVLKKAGLGIVHKQMLSLIHISQLS